MTRRLALLVGLAVAALTPTSARAQAPRAAPAGPVCGCRLYPGPHIHAPIPNSNPAPARRRPAWLYGTSADGQAGADRTFPIDPARGPTLPRGRRYYGGRYFGSFNNRFYGPQYGYF